MPDRTKLPRANTGKGPGYTTIDGDTLRTSYNQNTKIPDEWVNIQLEDQFPIQTVGNQQAGPKAVEMNYYPTGQETVKREGLKGSASKLPKSSKYA